MTHTEEGVLAAAEHLIDAFGRHDIEAYFAAFAPDASFIFHNLDRVLKSRAEYEQEWKVWERRDGFRVLGCRSSERAVQMSGHVAVFTHIVETDISLGGERLTNRERETVVFGLGPEGQWLAFHEHLSALPS